MTTAEAREINRRVAQALGYRVEVLLNDYARLIDPAGNAVRTMLSERKAWTCVPNWAGDLTAAMGLLLEHWEAFPRRGWEVGTDGTGLKYCVMYDRAAQPTNYWSIEKADSLPLAIATAWLAAQPAAADR